MQADDTETNAQLRIHRLELVDPTIAENHGYIIKTTGGGQLVKLASVADSGQCVVKIQTSMKRRNQDLAKDQRIEFRIGINLGGTSPCTPRLPATPIHRLRDGWLAAMNRSPAHILGSVITECATAQGS